MSRWPAGFAAASLVFAAWTLIHFTGQAFRDGLTAAVLLGVVFSAALASGGLLGGLLKLSGADRGESILIGATLGLGVLSLSVFGLGALGLLKPLPVSLLLGFFCLAGFSRLREAASVLRQALPTAGRHPAAAGFCAVLGLLFWTTWVPPHQYDSLVYHLALPEAYARAGRLVVVDHLLFSHFPQNGEMLFTLALLMGSSLLAQMIVWLCTVLSVGWILLAGARFLPPSVALLGGGLLSTHTAVMLLSGTTYVEPIVMLWNTAAVFSFLRWRLDGEARPQNGWLPLSAVFCGLALGAKYYAGITAGLLGGFLLLRLLVGGQAVRRKAADWAVFCAVTTAVFSPWLIKNLIMVGNPLFPFFYRYFSNAGVGWEGQAAKDYFQVLTEYGHGGNALQALVKVPFMLLGNSRRFGGGMDVLGNFGWELSFWCLPLALWAARGNRLMRWLLLYFFFYLGVWFSTGVVLRFLTVTAPLLCLLAAFGLHAVWSGLRTPARLCLTAAVGLLTAVHFFVFGFVHQIFGSGAVLFGLEDGPAFLSRRLDYYPCARWSAGHLGKNDKLLIVGEQRGYYVGRNHSATTVNAPNRFLQWASQEPTASAFAGRLRKEGFSHLMLVPREAERLAPLMRPFSETAWANVNGLNLETVFQGPFCRVYSLSQEAP